MPLRTSGFFESAEDASNSLAEILKARKDIDVILRAVGGDGRNKDVTIPAKEVMESLKKGKYPTSKLAGNEVGLPAGSDYIMAAPEKPFFFVDPDNSLVIYYGFRTLQQEHEKRGEFHPLSHVSHMSQTESALDKAGFKDMYVGLEPEFFITKDLGIRTNDGVDALPVYPFNNSKSSKDHGTVTDSLVRKFKSEILRYFDNEEVTGKIQLEGWHKESGPEQQEILLPAVSYKVAPYLLMALKDVAEKLAKKNGLIITFDPKPDPTKVGTGLHFNFSFIKEEIDGQKVNVFSNPEKPGHLTLEQMWAIRGVLDNSLAMQILLNTKTDSYVRLAAGQYAPTNISFGEDIVDRETKSKVLLRVPNTKGDLKQARLEVRTPDLLCNPAVMQNVITLAALDGVAKGRARQNEAGAKTGAAFYKEEYDSLNAVYSTHTKGAKFKSLVAWDAADKGSHDAGVSYFLQALHNFAKSRGELTAIGMDDKFLDLYPQTAIESAIERVEHLASENRARVQYLNGQEAKERVGGNEGAMSEAHKTRLSLAGSVHDQKKMPASPRTYNHLRKSLSGGGMFDSLWKSFWGEGTALTSDMMVEKLGQALEKYTPGKWTTRERSMSSEVVKLGQPTSSSGRRSYRLSVESSGSEGRGFTGSFMPNLKKLMSGSGGRPTALSKDSM